MTGFEPDAAQLAELRRVLGLPPDASERQVAAGIMLALGAADDLVADVDDLLWGEMEYLTTATRLGWPLDGA